MITTRRYTIIQFLLIVSKFAIAFLCLYGVGLIVENITISLKMLALISIGFVVLTSINADTILAKTKMDGIKQKLSPEAYVIFHSFIYTLMMAVVIAAGVSLCRQYLSDPSGTLVALATISLLISSENYKKYVCENSRKN